MNQSPKWSSDWEVSASMWLGRRATPRQRVEQGAVSAHGSVDESWATTFPGLKVLVRSVAEGRSFGMFALAPGHGFGLVNLNFQGRELSSFVGTVAKRLRLGFPASAPPIGSFFGLLNGGGFLSDDWNFHG